MPPISLNRRAILAFGGAFLFLLLLSGAVTNHVRPDLVQKHIPDSWKSTLPPPQQDQPPPPPKKEGNPEQAWQEEIFPLAKAGKVPKINPKNIVRETNLKTPLLIGFTRNWYLLEQAVVSYLAAGWPASQLIVVDNTGVMDSNLRGLLTAKNPWYLNHTRLTQLGVSVKRTPTLLSFAQLQNFFINYAIEQDWGYFFWSHMDVVVLSDELLPEYKSVYERAVEVLANTLEERRHWGLKLFAYDWLTLVNVEAMKDVGGWDTQIPFYMTDCDVYARMAMRNWTQDPVSAGFIYDVGSHLKDLAILYPEEGHESELNTTRFNNLKKELEAMMKEKQSNNGGRNYWQARQDGGQGEPFWRNPKGFERGINFWIDKGRELFRLKWNYGDCDLIAKGYGYGDDWTDKKPNIP
ncbi:hypothetical protein TWF106_010283 [Orbilia oligospora]|uniref:Nucleotide-diphospho-sugar transferase domain-containing protein n=2 Tax=Orbilia oligospora TaxID=2813651 RepID=A0A7C8URZ2_ORBOL|nr:hypothetical protein TWF679_006698 [Orbilia oligospora]KAF3211398.1 hypothetical protein TWF106_010283 [Orbilia oligospora]KAF3219228.1 hypothetical protein TWF191_008022 [Orbilia oligospora]